MSQIFDAVAYLVATARSTWANDATVVVFDGPTPADFELEAQNRIWIGADPTKLDAEGDDAVTGDQEVATLSQGRTRTERFAITCAIEHWDGGTDLSEARAAVKGYFNAFEQLLRGVPLVGPGDITLGGALGASGWAQIAGGIQLHQEQQPTGCDVVLVFHVSCTARLTT